MSGLTPAAPLAVFCSLPRKLLPVSTGSYMSSPYPCFSRFYPAATDLQNNSPASGTLPAPDLTAS
ncbi:hypothetical protein ECDEC7D_5321 [Escherichia coli DEC7D]|nr:hypothetical protein ECDEC7D_5321 [Escherichia coli DEC7D]